MRTCQTPAGIITDGDLVTLTLAHGASKRVVSGTIRGFDQVTRILDDEGYAVDRITDPRWEIVTGDPWYPAIGFLPEHVLAVE